MPVFFKQKVNSLLCITLISLMTFWVGLYYFSSRAENIGQNWAVADNTTALK